VRKLFDERGGLRMNWPEAVVMVAFFAMLAIAFWRLLK